MRRVERSLEIASERANIEGCETKLRNGTERESKITKTQDPAPPKWWGNSITVWGVVITAAVALLLTLGLLTGFTINATMVRELGENVVPIAQAVAVLIGTAITICGRSLADHPLVRRSVMLRTKRFMKVGSSSSIHCWFRGRTLTFTPLAGFRINSGSE